MSTKQEEKHRHALQAEWQRGYFCAVAIYLRENCADDVADPAAKSMFRNGGSTMNADAEDVETFKRHGLIKP